ncbi:hypothetical protein ABVT39_028073 [Epinephelus coioides]
MCFHHWQYFFDKTDASGYADADLTSDSEPELEDESDEIDESDCITLENIPNLQLTLAEDEDDEESLGLAAEELERKISEAISTMHFPSNPLQPGPMYFLTPRKCGLYGVSCEGLQKTGYSQLLLPTKVGIIMYLSHASVNDEQDDLNDSVSQDLLLPEPEFQPLQKSVQRRIGSLLLRLQAVLHVSQSAIQEIVDDLFDIGVCAGQTTRQVIESILKGHNCTSEELTSSLTEAIQNANALNFLSREGPLGTDHKRQLFYRQNFTVIEPIEYVLSTQERTHTVVYVPILKLLSEVLKREEVLQVLGAGCPEVVINKRKGADVKGKRVKKSKKGEVNYCPDPPEGQSPESVEEKRKMMEMEMLKKDPDHQLIEDLMTSTFSQGRREIIGDEPLITEVISRWPALFHERQIKAEFKRIVTTDLLESFLDGLDGLVPRLLEMYKATARSGKKQALKDILDCLEKDDTNERRRTAAVLGLPHYISGEDPSDVIRMCDVLKMFQCMLAFVVSIQSTAKNVFRRMKAGNVPASVSKSVFVCASHFTTDCFSNEGQYKAGLATQLFLKDGSIPTVRGDATDEVTYGRELNCIRVTATEQQ